MDIARFISKPFLLTAFLALSFTGVSAQKVNLSFQDAPFEQVLHAIKQQTGLSLVFSEQLVDVNRKVSIQVNSVDVQSALKQLLAGTNIDFEIKNKKLYLIEKPKREFPQSGAVTKKRLTGQISTPNGDPAIGATVIDLHTKAGTITDIEGHFALDVDKEALLQISYVGFTPVEISVGDNQTLNVKLQEEIKALDEVVVVGYGVQKKVNLTGAVTAVSVNDIGKRQVSNTSIALQGLIPGLSAIQRGGSPSDAAGLRVRGYTSLGNVTPLILVDGIEMGIDNIDPSIIESISVLKDAASASIYGNRAAAGVILITTKRAKTEQIHVTYNGFIGQQQAITYPKNVGAIEHMELLSEAQRNVGITPTFTDEYINTYRENMGKNSDLYPNTDWYRGILTNSGLMQSHTLSISGGSKKVSIMGVIGYLGQKGIIENVEKKRSFLRINSDIEISSKLKAKFDAHISQTDYQQPTRSAAEAFHWAMRIPANKAAVLSDGKWGEGWNGQNPVAFTRVGGLTKDNNPSVTLNLGMEYNPFDWMKMKFSYSPNYWTSYGAILSLPVTSFYPDGGKAYDVPQENNLQNTYTQNRIHQLNASVDIRKTFDDHFISAIAGFQQEDFRCDGFNGIRKNFVFPAFSVLSGGSTKDQQTYGWAYDWAMRSLFGRVNYIFKNRYLLEVNARYDGSSRFARGHKWGMFPSVSAGWRISEESFWRFSKHI